MAARCLLAFRHSHRGRNVKEGVVVLLLRTVDAFVGTGFVVVCGGIQRGVPFYEPQCRPFDNE